MALSVLRLFFSRLTFIYHTNLSFSDIYIFFQHYNFVVSTFTARAQFACVYRFKVTNSY